MQEVTYRIRKAWSVRARWSDTSYIRFGATAGKVRYSAFLEIADAYSDMKLFDVLVHRAKGSDMRLPGRHELADQLSKDALHCLLHSYGANSGDPYKAGYRDYFYTNRDNPHLVECQTLGLMTPMKGDCWGEGMTYFVLTDLGKNVALSCTPLYARGDE